MVDQARAEERDVGRRRSVAESQPRPSMDRRALEPDLVNIFLVPEELETERENGSQI
jgi:hypothetical protein